MMTHPDPTLDAASPEQTAMSEGRIEQLQQIARFGGRDATIKLGATEIDALLSDYRALRAVLAERDAEIGRLTQENAFLRGFNEELKAVRDGFIAMSLSEDGVPDER